MCLGCGLISGTWLQSVVRSSHRKTQPIETQGHSNAMGAWWYQSVNYHENEKSELTSNSANERGTTNINAQWSNGNFIRVIVSVVVNYRHGF